MFVTEHFVFLHLPKAAGTYIEMILKEDLAWPLLLESIHGRHKDLPDEFKSKTTVGIWRNPWEWYASLYFYAKGKRNATGFDLISAASNHFELDFQQTLPKLLDPDDQFIKNWKATMESRGGALREAPWMGAGMLGEVKASGLGLMGFLAQEIFPEKLDHEWTMENLRDPLFKFLSPLCKDRERFRLALVSKPKNVSRKPGLETLYSNEGVAMVAEKEKAIIECWKYQPPRMG